MAQQGSQGEHTLIADHINLYTETMLLLSPKGKNTTTPPISFTAMGGSLAQTNEILTNFHPALTASEHWTGIVHYALQATAIPCFIHGVRNTTYKIVHHT